MNHYHYGKVVAKTMILYNSKLLEQVKLLRVVMPNAKLKSGALTSSLGKIMENVIFLLQDVNIHQIKVFSIINLLIS